jgi:S-formylglutathione hydrolase FrmB
MIESGKVKPFIIVMPNGNRVERDVSTTSLYDDHCETGLDIVARALKAVGDRLDGLRIYKVSCEGNFEDYIVSEVVREVSERYRTNGERYIGGFSIGGRAAVQLALGNDGVFDGAFGLSGNYDYVRQMFRDGELLPTNGMKLFLASGDKDQRGVYGELNTFLFHKDLASREIEHLYCIYDGTHSNMAWVAAMPGALRYLLAGDGEETADEPACGG